MQSSEALSAYRKSMRIIFKISPERISKRDSAPKICLIFHKNRTNFYVLLRATNAWGTDIGFPVPNPYLRMSKIIRQS
jgi:hypothetical protein